MKLDQHCSASGMFVYYDIPAFGELQRKHITTFNNINTNKAYLIKCPY